MKLPIFYRQQENKFSKCFLFWGGIVCMLVIFFVLAKNNDIKIPQQDIIIDISISDEQ